ncbi:MAG: hypothetical protein A3J05_02160 [Candidatus Doudnabacteria bacterium RIFCSPLOWO2_02_FULL_48_13]|uniref:Uncharacterized protein n=1 Tax=Candidatus Doudnabacteria bacterium RIFCSPLOWO2_02_FULL_48_13 TaxID=1817845 RepID=A0A1F5QCW4_9BACT|nr:MAG: hypothetical protein A3J05_02160 [Candidatus Doudnabacteria bacterium RIFCSPLOWO2_02_FULL_48_13]
MALLKATELLRQSWEIFKQKIKTLILLQLVPLIAAIPAVILFGVSGFMEKGEFPKNLGGGDAALIIGALVVVVIAALIQMWAQVAILLAIDNQNAEPGVKNMLMTVAGIIFGPVATVYGYLIYRALQDQKMTPVAAPAPAMPASPPLIV